MGFLSCIYPLIHKTGYTNYQTVLLEKLDSLHRVFYLNPLDIILNEEIEVWEFRFQGMPGSKH